MDSKVVIHFGKLPDEDLAALDSIVRKHGLIPSPVPKLAAAPKPEFTGFELLAIAGAAVLVAKFITSEMEKRKGGVRIDLDAVDAKIVRRDPSLPYGYVLIYGGGEKARIDIHEKPRDWMDRFLEQVVSASMKTANEAIKAAKTLGIGEDKIEKDPTE